MTEKYSFDYFKTGKEIDERTRKGIIELHYAADKDFIPPLSRRRQKIEDIPDLNSRFLVLKYEGRIAGVIIFWDYYWKCRSAYIGNTIVSRNFRKLGFGQLLIKESVKRLRLDGIHLVKTNTWSNNMSSINMLEKCGFTKYYTVRDARGKGIHKIWLRRSL